MLTARPHDLLRLSDSATLPADAPAWAADALRIAPWVVVRRAAATAGSIAVGVRGATRSERFAMPVRVADVHDAVTPEALTHRAFHGRDLPAIRTLSTVSRLLDGTGLRWGPTGSVGFALATGQPTVTVDSDLDLLIRTCDMAAALPLLTTLHRQFRSLAVRVDCQIETSSGAVALAELTGAQPDVMLRTDEGPRLVSRAVVS